MESSSTIRLSHCPSCGTNKNLKKCSRCEAVWYCSEVCQKEDWPIHKLERKENISTDDSMINIDNPSQIETGTQFLDLLGEAARLLNKYKLENQSDTANEFDLRKAQNLYDLVIVMMDSPARLCLDELTKSQTMSLEKEAIGNYLQSYFIMNPDLIICYRLVKILQIKLVQKEENFNLPSKVYLTHQESLLLLKMEKYQKANECGYKELAMIKNVDVTSLCGAPNMSMEELVLEKPCQYLDLEIAAFRAIYESYSRAGHYYLEAATKVSNMKGPLEYNRLHPHAMIPVEYYNIFARGPGAS